MKPWIVGAVDAALFLFGWSAIALAAAPDAQAALLVSACWLLPVSIAMWALGTRQARAILAGRGGLRRAAWAGSAGARGLGWPSYCSATPRMPWRQVARWRGSRCSVGRRRGFCWMAGRFIWWLGFWGVVMRWGFTC